MERLKRRHCRRCRQGHQARGNRLGRTTAVSVRSNSCRSTPTSVTGELKAPVVAREGGLEFQIDPIDVDQKTGLVSTISALNRDLLALGTCATCACSTCSATSARGACAQRLRERARSSVSTPRPVPSRQSRATLRPAWAGSTALTAIKVTRSIIWKALREARERLDVADSRSAGLSSSAKKDSQRRPHRLPPH